MEQKLLLDKCFDNKGVVTGFKLYNPSIQLDSENLNYVYMVDVELTCITSIERPSYPYVLGVVKSSLPVKYRLSAATIDLIRKLPELKYCTASFNGFYLEGSNTKIESAREIYAYEGKIRVLL